MVFENRLSDDFNKSNPAGAKIRDTQIFLQFSKRNPKAIIVSMSCPGSHSFATLLCSLKFICVHRLELGVYTIS